jgi:hypothetical protein
MNGPIRYLLFKALRCGVSKHIYLSTCIAGTVVTESACLINEDVLHSLACCNAMLSKSVTLNRHRAGHADEYE